MANCVGCKVREVKWQTVGRNMEFGLELKSGKIEVR